jgi:hypothetical protein
VKAGAASPEIGSTAARSAEDARRASVNLAGATPFPRASPAVEEMRVIRKGEHKGPYSLARKASTAVMDDTRSLSRKDKRCTDVHDLQYASFPSVDSQTSYALPDKKGNEAVVDLLASYPEKGDSFCMFSFSAPNTSPTADTSSTKFMFGTPETEQEAKELEQGRRQQAVERELASMRKELQQRTADLGQRTADLRVAEANAALRAENVKQAEAHASGAKLAEAEAMRKTDQLKQQLEMHRCVVCQDEPTAVLLMPCRHLCVCKGCSGHAQLTKCPMCRAAVSEKMHVFVTSC